ncbi:MAG: ThuA domain-containing protein, partial [Deltaproteobacteria bacterium]|nr:ThuA domain-containing protein [Nannocystaceae bacterium]
QDAIVHVVAAEHPACAGLPASWMRFDEWYNFTSNPSKQVDVLLQLDESSYTGGTMGRDHPIAWTHVLSGARVFYTAGGHTNEAWADPLWLGHVVGGMQWVIEGEPVGGSESSSSGEGGSSGGPDTSTSAGVDEGSSTAAAGSSEGGSSVSPTSAAGSSDDTGGAAADETSSGSGCRQARAPGWLALLLLLLPALSRRRRAPGRRFDAKPSAPA